MGKSDIKKFYECALEEGRFNSEFFKELKNFSTENELKDFLKDKILPIAKKMGYNFSVEELLTYEKETVHKIKEYQLENVNGGVSVKNLVLGGVVSLMALGAGIFGTTNSASAMKKGAPTNTVTSESTVHGQGPSGSPEAQGEPDKTIEEERAQLIGDIKEELTHFLERTRSELWRLIRLLHPRAKLILNRRIDKLVGACTDDIIRKRRFDSEMSVEEIKLERDELIKKFYLEFSEFKHTIRDIRLANMQVNDVVLRLREIFGANIDNVSNGTVYNEALKNFNILMNDIERMLLHGFNEEIAQMDKLEEIQRETNAFESSLYNRFRDEILRKFPQPIVKNSIRNADKMKRSFQHTIDRGDTPQLNNRKPRLAQLLETDEAIPLKPSEERELNTPFGKVKVKNPRVDYKGPQNSRVIIIPNSNKAPTYVEIAQHLDRYYREQGPNLTLEMLYAILNYLDLPAEEGDNVQNVLERLNSIVTNNTELMPNATGEQRESAAVLCGILMVCESGQNRSQNGGKRERGVIRALIESVIFGSSKTPFAEAFGFLDCRGEQGVEYEGYYTPAAKIVRDKKDNRKILKQGGMVRGKVVVGKVNPEDVYPPIPKETLENDLINTEKLLLSPDSWEEYEEGDIF